MMCNEHAYCLAIEKLMVLEVPVRAQYIQNLYPIAALHGPLGLCVHDVQRTRVLFGH